MIAVIDYYLIRRLLVIKGLGRNSKENLRTKPKIIEKSLLAISFHKTYTTSNSLNMTSTSNSLNMTSKNFASQLLNNC